MAINWLGVFIVSRGSENALAGLLIQVVSLMLYLAAFIYVVKLAKRQAGEKEDRLKKLEADVEILKSQKDSRGEQK